MDLLLRDGREGKGRAFLAAFAAPGGGRVSPDFSRARQSGLDEVRMEASRGRLHVFCPFNLEPKWKEHRGATQKQSKATERRRRGRRRGWNKGLEKANNTNAIKSHPWVI